MAGPTKEITKEYIMSPLPPRKNSGTGPSVQDLMNQEQTVNKLRYDHNQKSLYQMIRKQYLPFEDQ
jgi:hypothetical protein